MEEKTYESDRTWRCFCGGQHFVSLRLWGWEDGATYAYLDIADCYRARGWWARLRVVWDILRHGVHEEAEVELAGDEIFEMAEEMSRLAAVARAWREKWAKKS